MILKAFHTIFAALTISGFLVRGYWMMTGSALLQKRAARIAPHVIDTLFLISGIWLIVALNLAPMQHAWLLAKFAGLIGYIGLGMVAMRFGRTPQIRVIAFVGAVAAFAYIVGVALTKSPMSWIAY
ncbi:MAG: SirB2 family protein [Gammaproteobacteria bacterium]|nr:SirB2 family protein [Gammaproteobacteria bacterium]MDH3750101.1 SirB2 family protein [Gammaproteobacteria bacterium]